MIPSLYEEDLNPKDYPNPADFVIATAVNKVDEVEQRLKKNGEKFDLIIGADTMVWMDNKIFGKPKDENEAFSILKSFSGNCHSVFSGVCIRNQLRSVTFSECTKVYFGQIPDEVLHTYVKSGDPMDKAGGYGIQVKGGSFIEKIEGDYFNVVGLPLYSLCKQIYELYSCDKKHNQ